MDKTIKQAVDEFNADDYDNALSDESRLEKKRADFVDHFSPEYIKSMDIDEYVIGTGAKSTFCYRLEHELDGLGSVSTPAGSTIYGIWAYDDAFDMGRKEYRTQKTIVEETRAQQIFEGIRKDILMLLLAAQKHDRLTINNSALHSNFRMKLLYTYYPDDFQNLCSKTAASTALHKLGINSCDTDDIVALNDSLSDWKNGNSETAGWTNYVFMRFLYDKLGIGAGNQSTTEAGNKRAEEAAAHIREIREEEEAKEKETAGRNTENAGKIGVGAEVTHKAVGKGVVKAFSDDCSKITIDFEKCGEKKLSMNGIFDHMEVL